MNTMKQLALLVLLLVIAGCGSPAKTADTSDAAPSDDGILTDVKALFKSGLAAKCEMTTPEGTATMYISGKNQRIDSESDGRESHMISDGTWMHAWSKEGGVKMNLEKLKAAGDAMGGNTGNTQTPEDFATAPGVDVKCRPTAVAGSMFVPPSDVKFTDLSAMMDQMQSQFS